ncbi:MAG: methyltransferase domain-containing protein [Oceanococcaceae bacterium]
MSITSVLDRYSAASQTVEPALCCPVDYDTALLKILPAEIIERDYGCGDPSRYVHEGDVVLDLGSGGGKICYMAAQLVGPEGRVIGVDMNDDMLALARQYQPEMARVIGSDRVAFHKGKIEDLALSMDAAEEWLAAHPIRSSADLLRYEAWAREQRQAAPMIPDSSVDLVVSNCVLNLVGKPQRAQMIAEIFRVLRPGGRVAISDIISDEDVPAHLQSDPTLWSGCISGAFQEEEFLQAFLDAGFAAVAYDKWDAQPWQVVEGIEFRSATLVATKPAGTVCIDRGHAVIYKGPFASVADDEGHEFPRGARMAVCERTFAYLTTGPLADSFIGITPRELAPPQEYCAPMGTRRPAAVSQGGSHSGQSCAPESGSCC